MAVRRERPYSAFNYLVQLGDGADPSSAEAGFQEVSGLGIELTVQEYRSGNSAVNAPTKIIGMHKVSDVTLKRGVIGTLDLYEWLDAVRAGTQGMERQVIITLRSEDRETEAMKWKLTNAVPIKYTGPALNGKGTDVAIEELVLAAELIELM
jgi:phage tail-like protein